MFTPILMFGYLCLCGFFLLHVLRAKEGFEDEEGFHAVPLPPQNRGQVERAGPELLRDLKITHEVAY